MTWEQWHYHPASILGRDRFRVTEWIAYSDMTEQEKERYPKANVTDGYLKKLSYHQAWSEFWNSLSNEEKEYFYSLPGFDSTIFEEITGIKVEKE